MRSVANHRCKAKEILEAAAAAGDISGGGERRIGVAGDGVRIGRVDGGAERPGRLGRRVRAGLVAKSNPSGDSGTGTDVVQVAAVVIGCG
jgi:hypothetical protein